MTDGDDDYGTIYERFREEFLRNRSLWQEWREIGESFPFRLLNALSKKLSVPSGYLDLYTVSDRPDWVTHSDGDLTRAISMDSATIVTDDGEWHFKLGLLLEPAPNAFPKTVLTAAGTFRPKSPTLFEVKMYGSNKVHAIDTSKPQPFEEICSDIIELIEDHFMRDPYRDARPSKSIGFVDFAGS
jgi:hypothetical protein